MKPSNRDYHWSNQSGNIKNPSKKEAELDVSHHPLVSPEGKEETFSLTSSFIG